MMNHTKAVDMIEGTVSKRKTFLGIRHFKRAGDAEQSKPLGCELYRFWRQVHPGVPCSIPSELKTVGRYAAADLQNVLPAKRRKLGHNGHMPLATLVAFSGNVFKVPSPVLFGG